MKMKNMKNMKMFVELKPAGGNTNDCQKHSIYR